MTDGSARSALGRSKRTGWSERATHELAKSCLHVTVRSPVLQSRLLQFVTRRERRASMFRGCEKAGAKCARRARVRANKGPAAVSTVAVVPCTPGSAGSRAPTRYNSPRLAANVWRRVDSTRRGLHATLGCGGGEPAREIASRASKLRSCSDRLWASLLFTTEPSQPSSRPTRFASNSDIGKARRPRALNLYAVFFLAVGRSDRLANDSTKWRNLTGRPLCAVFRFFFFFFCRSRPNGLALGPFTPESPPSSNRLLNDRMMSIETKTRSATCP